MRRRPVRPQVRLGRAVVGATALAVLAVAVSFAAGLGATGGVKHSLGSIAFKETSGGGQYDVLPVISSVAPAQGIVGDSVTITGTGFSDPDSSESISFNGTAATLNVVSDTEIDTTVPSGATTGPVTVHNSAGTGTSPGNFTVIQPPTISSLSATSGYVGGPVTINGTGFTGTTSVTFNGVSASFSVASDGQINTSVPSGATTGVIRVTNPAGHIDSATFTVQFATPVISSFSPGAAGAGQTVTITGNHLTGVNSVKVGSLAASVFNVLSDTQVSFTVPSGASTNQITVSSPSGSATSASKLTILALPVINSFSPTIGKDGSTAVTITGKAFTGTTAVTFNGTPASFTVKTDGSILTTVPGGATTGKIGVTTGAGSTLSASNFTVFAVPTISSFTPESQVVGGSVTIFGTNLQGTTLVSFPGASATTGISVSSDGTSLTVNVPTGATGAAHLTVTNPKGTSLASTDSFTVLTSVLAPTVSSVSPNTGPANASATTQVTITGTNFAGVTSVLFNGKPATGVSINGGGTSITATTPVGATSGDVTVVNKAGTSAKTSADKFTVLPQPAISGFSPTSTAGGSQVTISGTNLLNSNGSNPTVSFGGSANAVTFVGTQKATMLVVTLPSDKHTGQITVHTDGGTGTSAGTFFVLAPATVASLSPTAGKATTPVTVTGTGFLGGPTPIVSFGGVTATGVHVNSDTSLTVPAPSQGTITAATPETVKVTNGTGTPSNGVTFTYEPAPAVVSLSPTHGPANTSRTTQVDITGTFFTAATAVMFNGKAAASFTVNSDTDITAFAPAGATTGKVTVVTPSGTNTTGPVFTVDAQPSITKFSPDSGYDGTFNSLAATQVTITGANFSQANDSVSFNGVNQPVFNVSVDGKTITANVPLGATTGPITVTDVNNGVATSPASFIVVVPPTVTGFTPGSGVAGPSTKVTITGSGFSGSLDNLVVKFGWNGVSGVPATTLKVNSDTSVTATLPAGSSATLTGPIHITNAASPTGVTTLDTFFVSSKPTIAGFTPGDGPASAFASMVVDISGNNFNGTTAVLFNGKPSPFVVVDDNNDITTIVPVGATTGKISVVNPAGTVMSASAFVVDPMPSVSSMTPTKGATNDVVTINGNGLADIADADFVNAPGATIDSETNNQLKVEVPDLALTGPITLTDAFGQIVSTPIFSVIQTPQVASFSDESTGSFTDANTLDPVIINGLGFTGATSVKFNGSAASSFVVVSDTMIIARVPHGATTGTISVTNEAGTGTSAGSLTIHGA